MIELLVIMIVLCIGLIIFCQFLILRKLRYHFQQINRLREYGEESRNRIYKERILVLPEGGGSLKNMSFDLEGGGLFGKDSKGNGRFFILRGASFVERRTEKG